MQSRIDSFMEAATNTCIGLVISELTLLFVNWLYALKMSPSQNFGYVSIFTVISVIRSYTLRRIFNGKSVWCAIKERF